MGIFTRLLRRYKKHVKYKVDMEVRNGDQVIFVLPGVTVDARDKVEARKRVEHDLKLKITGVQRKK